MKGIFNQVKVALFVQVLNSFAGGILTVALPLMMQDRNIDIVTIGFVFASMPMIFQIGRMFFATISDFWGRKLFFVLHALLGVVSNSIYYFAATPLEFLFGKVMEGTKDGSLWAVNRAFILEESKGKWRALVHLRTTAYISLAFGSLLAGFLIVWFLYEGALLLAILIGAFAIPSTLLLASGKKKKFKAAEALHLLDIRKKEREFKIFLALYFAMGLSFGFISGFVFPLFLSENGFDTEAIGVFIGSQILLAGVFSYLFAGRVEIRKLILISGVLYTTVLVLLGFSSSMFAAVFVITYGIVDGLLSIGQEGILSKISNKESYGIDIGLLMMGLHGGRTMSMAMSGLLISMFGFAIPFLTSAFVLTFFYTGSYLILKRLS